MVNTKSFLYRCLHNPTTSEGRLVNGLFSFLILFSLAVIPLHLFAKMPSHQWIEANLLLFDKISKLVFTPEWG